MIRILASDFNNYEKRDGQKIAHPMDNSNGIVDQIKSSLKDYKKIVFVASDMDNSHENVLVYANILFDSMKMVGINFDEYLVLDGENRKRADEYSSKKYAERVLEVYNKVLNQETQNRNLKNEEEKLKKLKITLKMLQIFRAAI